MGKLKNWLIPALAVLCFALPGAGIAEIYKYVDDNGVTSYIDNPNRAPAQYRSRVKLVTAKIQVVNTKSPVERRLNELTGRSEVSWKSFMILDKDENPIGVNVRAMFLQGLFESKLIYWLAGSFIVSVAAIIMLIMFRNYPTAAGRRNSIVAILVIWIGGGIAVTSLFTLPAARMFLATSRGYLSQIIKEAPIDEQGKKTLDDLDVRLADLQDKLPH